jgi:hypothetical protein
MLAYIYYNSRVLGSETCDGAGQCSWEGCLERMEFMPELYFTAAGMAIEPEEEGAAE